MARVDPNQPLLGSVLDRLLEGEPDEKSDDKPPRSKPHGQIDVATNDKSAKNRSRGQTLSELRQAIRRDLENLLNAHQRCRSWPDYFIGLERSLINFGTPDYSGANLSSENERNRFRGEIETAIRHFEPRFKTVRVSFAETGGIARSLRFRIEVLMHADPIPEHLVFDTQLDPANRRFAIIGKKDD